MLLTFSARLSVWVVAANKLHRHRVRVLLRLLHTHMAHRQHEVSDSHFVFGFLVVDPHWWQDCILYPPSLSAHKRIIAFLGSLAATMTMMIRRINGRVGWEMGNWNGYLGRHNIAFCYCEIKSSSWHFYIRGCAWRSYWHERKDRK